jgi:hypothetical protein
MWCGRDCVAGENATGRTAILYRHVVQGRKWLPTARDEYYAFDMDQNEKTSRQSMTFGLNTSRSPGWFNHRESRFRRSGGAMGRGERRRERRPESRMRPGLPLSRSSEVAYGRGIVQTSSSSQG